jgi:hypothetical protein
MANSARPYIEQALGKKIRTVLKEHSKEYSEIPEVLQDLKISRDTLKRYVTAEGGRFVHTIWLPDEDQP